MNLIHGNIISTAQCEEIILHLEEHIQNTLSKGCLNPLTVVSACEKLMQQFDETSYLPMIEALGVNPFLAKNYIHQAKQMFSSSALLYRMEKELGPNWQNPTTYTPKNATQSVTEMIKPLGVLLHIAAGNVDGLPALSVLEGLLTGNINILKLPAQEGGISVRLLKELISVEPTLAEYIYVFDYSSKDLVHLEKLAKVSDGIVVWGGQEAVTAFRHLAKPNTKLIEWGHKISFAYVTQKGIQKNGLEGIAQNIMQTGQLLCSSCQGIFLDTNDIQKVYQFCHDFLPILQHAANGFSHNSMETNAKVALELYCQKLETMYTHNRIFAGTNCSITAINNHILEPSMQFGNPWVKPLEQNRLLQALRPHKNHLQTVGLLCHSSEEQALAETIFHTGVVRICHPSQMSVAYCGEPHDGEYPLRKYTKVVSQW